MPPNVLDKTEAAIRQPEIIFALVICCVSGFIVGVATTLLLV